jgi:glycerol-3-phosphate O-acyltransferase
MKYRYQKKKREDILEMAEDAEELTKQVLGDEYVHFKDAIPEIKEFLVEIERKEKENPQK